MYPVYYVIEGDVLPVLFHTFGTANESITMSGFATTDIAVYKDGSTTERSSTSGYTLLDTDGTDFDSLTGIHGFSIDLNDNTDAGFYSVGPWYHIVVSAITVSAQTVRFVASAFRILDATRGMAGTALPDAAADAAGGLPISDAGGLDLDAQVGTKINSILDDTGTSGVIVGTLSSAAIDSILDDSVTEPAGVFTWAGATVRNVLGWMAALSRNKITQTSTTQTLRNDADSASLATSTHSDDGTTHTRGEWS